MGKVKVTLIKSLIGTQPFQRKTVKALGLGKISSSREHELTPQIAGMIKSINHMLKVEEIK